MTVENEAIIAQQSNLVIAVLELVWRNQKAAVYSLGCICPGEHGLDWCIVKTSMRHQIMSLSRETQQFIKLLVPAPIDSDLPTPYRDVYGVHELHPPYVDRWMEAKDLFRYCPDCNAPWPL